VWEQELLVLLSERLVLLGLVLQGSLLSPLARSLGLVGSDHP